MVCFEKAMFSQSNCTTVNKQNIQVPKKWERKTKMINNCLHITMTLSQVKYYFIKNKLKTD